MLMVLPVLKDFIAQLGALRKVGFKQTGQEKTCNVNSLSWDFPVFLCGHY